MPKIYSPLEKERIREELRKAASTCLRKYGVRHTTVDELVRMVNIPKGTFYLFYASKESLFLDTLTSFTSLEEEKYLSMLEELDENHIVTSLTDIFFSIMMKFYKEGLYRFLDGSELELVLRRLPDGSVDKIRMTTRSVLHELFSYFAIEDEDDIKSFTAGYEALFYLLKDGEKIPDIEKTLRFLIRGLVLQMVE